MEWSKKMIRICPSLMNKVCSVLFCSVRFVTDCSFDPKCEYDECFDDAGFLEAHVLFCCVVFWLDPFDLSPIASMMNASMKLVLRGPFLFCSVVF
jgi:hypothetical protein